MTLLVRNSNNNNIISAINKIWVDIWQHVHDHQHDQRKRKRLINQLTNYYITIRICSWKATGYMYIRRS